MAHAASAGGTRRFCRQPPREEAAWRRHTPRGTGGLAAAAPARGLVLRGEGATNPERRPVRVVEAPRICNCVPGTGGALQPGIVFGQGSANDRTHVVRGAARREGVLATPLHIGQPRGTAELGGGRRQCSGPWL